MPNQSEYPFLYCTAQRNQKLESAKWRRSLRFLPKGQQQEYFCVARVVRPIWPSRKVQQTPGRDWTHLVTWCSARQRLFSLRWYAHQGDALLRRRPAVSSQALRLLTVRPWLSTPAECKGCLLRESSIASLWHNVLVSGRFQAGLPWSSGSPEGQKFCKAVYAYDSWEE